MLAVSNENDTGRRVRQRCLPRPTRLAEPATVVDDAIQSTREYLGDMSSKPDTEGSPLQQQLNKAPTEAAQAYLRFTYSVSSA